MDHWVQRASARALVLEPRKGSVEVHASGEAASVGAFDSRSSEGPPGAGVERVGRRAVALARIGRSRVIFEGNAC